VFVTAIGLTAFLACLARSGVDTYLVRRPESPEAKHYDLASTVIAAFAVALMAMGAMSVPLLARWYGNREFVPAYLTLLLTIPLVGLAGPPTAKLERALNFRAVAEIELGGQALALVVGLALAWRGASVWAPVIGHLTWQSFSTVAAFRKAGMVPRPHFDRTCAREMLAFGVGYTASQRAWQLRNLVNPLLVARFAGAEGAAFVALAIRVAEGLGFVRAAAGRLGIAALARLQDDKRKFSEALQSALTIQVLALGPLLCAFALVGPFAIPRLMGARWTPSLAIYPFVAAGVLVNSVFNLQASALFVMGKQWTVLKAYLSNVGVLAIMTFLLLPHLGIAAYGWAELAACLGYVFLHTGVARLLPMAQSWLIGWLTMFLVPLFVMQHRQWWPALVISMGGAVAMAWHRAGRDSTQHRRGRWEHFLVFLGKSRQRGFSYIASLLRYQANRRLYRWSIANNKLRTHTSASRDVGAEAVVCASPFLFEANLIPDIVAAVPAALKSATITEAEQVIRQCFTFRGQERSFGGVIRWNDCADGNLSWHWDLNRHKFFVTLGTGYYYSQRAEFLEELQQLWLNWIGENPAGRTLTWQYPFEVASRLQNWVWAFFLLQRSGRVERRNLVIFLQAMRDHASFLAAHLEYHWPNNHLLLEAKSLYEFSLLFPQFKESKRNLDKAGRVLERQVQEQILPDGTHSELSSMYHRIVSGELGALMLLCRRRGRPLRPEIEQRIFAAVNFSRALTRGDGSVPLLGDSAQADTNLRFYYSSRSPSDLDYWTGWQRVANLKEPTEESNGALRIFTDGGYGVMADKTLSRNHLTFDFGAFSRNRSPNHGHCDALSFTLHADGHDLIVDPGAYFPWDDDGRGTRHFRSTAAHNTLVIDGREQSELSSRCDVGRTARVRLLSQQDDPSTASLAAECRPYWAGRNGPAHCRRLQWSTKRNFTVHDEIKGKGRHSLQWYFHFAHDLEARENDGTVILYGRQNGRTLLRLHPVGINRLNLSLLRGRKSPPMGWVSLDSAQALPAWVAMYSAEVELPFSVTFEIEISLEDGGALPDW
jgi:PST family polysaccharide transporter